MKKFKLLTLSLALMTFALTSCQPDPAADFSADKATAETGEFIQFTNKSADAESYDWDFGDGTSSTEESPKKAYTAPGTYTVIMTATSPNGKKAQSAVLSVTINGRNAKFAGSYNGVVVDENLDEYPGTATITAIAGNPNSFTMAFPNTDIPNLTATISATNTNAFETTAALDAFGDAWAAAGSLSGNRLTVTFALSDGITIETLVFVGDK